MLSIAAKSSSRLPICVFFGGRGLTPNIKNTFVHLFEDTCVDLLSTDKRMLGSFPGDTTYSGGGSVGVVPQYDQILNTNTK